VKMLTYLKPRIAYVLFTLFIVSVGTVAYFIWGPGSIPEAGELLRGSRLKVTFGEDGKPKLFASVDNSLLAKYPVYMGNNLLHDGLIIIGYSEAAMMQGESLFERPGDSISGLFGIDVEVGGILRKTGTIVDDMHFITRNDYVRLDGEEAKAYFKLSEDGEAKAFYVLASGESMLLDFSSGGWVDYQVKQYGGKPYYPVILGSKEARMMKEESLIGGSGDRIDGFFGQDVHIAGILKPTGTALDMMHILPLPESELRG
jgi:hypothetical protein